MTSSVSAVEAIEKAMEHATPGPWKAVSDAHFDSGLVYTSVQPINIDEEAMKPLAMANGEYHVCRMSHTAAPWRFNYHRANARYIAACSPDRMREVLALARQAEALKRENAELREGLKPFAECAPEWEGEPDSLHVFFEWNDESAPVPSLPVADFRRARTLLKEEANAE